MASAEHRNASFLHHIYPLPAPGYRIVPEDWTEDLPTHDHVGMGYSNDWDGLCSKLAVFDWSSSRSRNIGSQLLPPLTCFHWMCMLISYLNRLATFPAWYICSPRGTPATKSESATPCSTLLDA